MKRIFVCFVIVLFAYCPFVAGADLIDAINSAVAQNPELSPVATEILDKIGNGAGAKDEEVAELGRQWDAAYKQAILAKANADSKRQEAEQRLHASRRAAVLSTCIKLRQQKVNARFSPSDDGTALEFVATVHAGYQGKSAEVVCSAVREDPLNDKWTVSYPKLTVVHGPGYSFVQNMATTCTVSGIELLGYLAKERGDLPPWGRD